MCEGDTMSILELISMLKECKELGIYTFFYKWPKTDMIRGLHNLDTDNDIVEMCELLPPSKVIYVYAITTSPITVVDGDGVPTQEFAPSQNENMEYVDHIEDMMQDNGGDVEDNVMGHFESEGESDEDYNPVDDREVLSDCSFYSDGSNMDSTDDEVCNHKNERNERIKKMQENCKGKGRGKKKGKSPEKTIEKDAEKVPHKENDTAEQKWTDEKSDSGDAGGNASDASTHYASSDEERMASNSTDDEEEVTFPVFNHNTEMNDPQFQIGMLFPTAKIFRAAVRKHAILHRRPIKQCRNYGIRVRFICEKPCEWKIYASKMNTTDTYQIKVYNPKHTCTATFHQKQINSRWIAEHYEDDIRMNPTWPLSAFLKKVVNDWHCHVSVFAIARAKRKALQNINGKHVDQYGRILEYGDQLLKVMPQSTV